MKYTVKQVAEFGGVSIAALHHYDRIGLLPPDSISESGYRMYTDRELERLQHILFFREIGFSLQEIKRMLDQPEFDRKRALEAHADILLLQKQRLGEMIDTVHKTIKSVRGGTKMAPRELFGGFDLTAIEESKRKMLTHAVLGNTSDLKELLSRDPGLANSIWGYYSPLHFAVRSGHIEAVQLLLDSGADATEKTLSWQDPPLIKARDRGYSEIADLLERHLASKFRVSPDGSAVAHIIRTGSREEILRALDDKPDAVHAGDERGNTPLHWAVLTRQIWLIDELLRRGANISATRVDGATPAQLTLHGDYWFRIHRDMPKYAPHNEWTILGHLIARGADYDIWTAAAVGDVREAARWLERDPTLANRTNSVDRRPIGYAARYGKEHIVRLLLEHGADPSAEERDAPRGSALWHAVAGGHETCARLLLEHGADPNAELEASGNPLYIATRNRRESLVQLLYASGATIMLDSACSLGRIDLVGEIIHADPSRINSGGDFGALCHAAGDGHTDMVKLLIRSGADLNAPWYANNFMGYAAGHSLDMVRLLLEAGADPNNANWLGITYLHVAAWNGNIPYAKLLIEFGANLNAVEEEYESTPLGWAAKNGQTDMVQFLLSRGADPHLPDNASWAQPLAWAERKGHANIAAILDGLQE